MANRSILSRLDAMAAQLQARTACESCQTLRLVEYRDGELYAVDGSQVTTCPECGDEPRPWKALGVGLEAL